jgi:hypothetical protein
MLFECLFSTSVFEVVGGHVQPKCPYISGKRRLFFGSASACARDVETSLQGFGAGTVFIHSLWSCVKQISPRGPHLLSVVTAGYGWHITSAQAPWLHRECLLTFQNEMGWGECCVVPSRT